MLNILWTAFFVVSFIYIVLQSLMFGNADLWDEAVNAIFSSAENAFNIAIGLTGMLCLWLGLLKIADKSGLTALLAKALRPLFAKIMPEVPVDNPAMGSMIMNIAANMLGLDNAATPFGLKAMEQLQTLNQHKEKASNAQILFMVINASAVTLIPVSILMYRTRFGSVNPSAVFMPILFATSVSTLVGFLSVALIQRLNIFNRVVAAYLGIGILIVGCLAWYFLNLSPELRLQAAGSLGNAIILSAIALFVGFGFFKKLNVYETFIEGAKEGFEVAVRIIPYLVAMLVAIAMLRASGLMNLIVSGLEHIFVFLGIDIEFVPALPTAMMKPLSGNAARSMMLETFATHGVDSFPSFVASVIQGSTETTFYVLAVYFGVVKITKVGAALPCALLADFAGIVAAVYLSYLFY
ncbi:MAG: spore maturation protein [Alphaproteobacteria bacterium]|nr:spore maturation protein [Alphaproteobacteria bacterium]